MDWNVGYSMATEKDTWAIQGIALFKLFKAMVLLAVLATSLRLIRHDPTLVITRWALSFHVDPDNYYLHTLLAWLLRIDVKHLELFAVGTGLYVLVFAVEGVGLWLMKPWAEYLTILSTAALLPLEGYQVVRHASITKCAILMLNTAIVVYLAERVQKRLAARERSRHSAV
jgi:uncharacterized membrane protein (DUF2068 family)